MDKGIVPAVYKSEPLGDIKIDSTGPPWLTDMTSDFSLLSHIFTVWSYDPDKIKFGLDSTPWPHLT